MTGCPPLERARLTGKWTSPKTHGFAVNTGDSARVGQSAQSIRDGLAATKNFSGVTGSVEFDGHNQNTRMDTVHYMETLPDLSWKALSWN